MNTRSGNCDPTGTRLAKRLGVSRGPTQSHWAGLLLLWLCAAVLSGCGLLKPEVDHTRFFVLTAPIEPRQSEGRGEVKRWNVGVRVLDLPAYLRNKSIVVRMGSNELHFANFARWAEPLDLGIGRVLKDTLSAAANVRQVVMNSHGEEGLDYEVTLHVLACEALRSPANTGSVRLSLSWEVRSVGNDSMVPRQRGFTAPPAAWKVGDFGQLAGLLSEAIVDAGRMLASELPLGPPASKLVPQGKVIP